jgi:hypothetical protein
MYTATITGATSVATSLPLANPYVWTFTTGSAANATRPRVTLTIPATTSPGPTTGVPSNTTISAVSSEDMKPSTLGAASFTVTCVNPCVSPPGIVNYDVGSRTALFTTASALTVGATYTATITTAATDLQGTAGMTNTGILTVINGDIGTIATATSSITGFQDTHGDIYTESPANIGAVNGTILTCTNSTAGPTVGGPNAANCAAATQARLDAQKATTPWWRSLRVQIRAATSVRSRWRPVCTPRLRVRC